jgi:hypothetical protein
MFSVTFNNIDLFHSNRMGPFEFIIFHLLQSVLRLLLASEKQAANNDEVLQTTESLYRVVRGLRVVVCGRF